MLICMASLAKEVAFPDLVVMRASNGDISDRLALGNGSIRSELMDQLWVVSKDSVAYSLVRTKAF